MGNLHQDSGECYSFNIPGNVLGNVREDSGKGSKRFREMLLKILGNAQEDSGNVQKDSRECSRRFRGMFENIPGNVKEDSGESTF